jgi:hypothetical protein
MIPPTPVLSFTAAPAAFDLLRRKTMVSQSTELKVGEVYSSTQLGQYLLLGKEGSNLKIRRANAVEENIEAAFNEKIVHDFVDEMENFGFTANSEERRRKFCRALGFLAKAGDLHVELTPGYVATFKERYQQLTGGPLPEGSPSFKVLQSDGDKWGPELMIDWTASMFQMNQIHFGQHIQMSRRENQGEYRISNNQFIYKLLEWGFFLGDKQDADRIRNRLPESVRAEFDKGLKY